MQTPFLAQALPDPTHVFDEVWGVSPLGAVLGLFAVICAAAAVFQFLELRSERKSHRLDCAKKDAALALVNEQLRTLLGNATNATLGLINKLEVMQTKADTTQLREEVGDLAHSLRNGLRAIGNELKIPSERLNID